jgi:hypothetical protein
MDVKRVGNATISGGNYDGMIPIDEADVADKSLIQDVVNDFALVERAFRQTLHCSSLGWNKSSRSLHAAFSYT